MRSVSTRDDLSSRRLTTIVVAVAFSIWLLFFVATQLRGSTLVTPTSVPTTLLSWTGAIAGGAFGIWAVFAAATLAGRKRWIALLWAPLFALINGMVARDLAWDLANVIAFRGATAPIVLTPFPIQTIENSGRSGPYVTTGGAGPQTRHSISRADYAILTAPDRALPLRRYCLPLGRQQEGMAVRVFTSARVRITERDTKVTIAPCPAWYERGLTPKRQNPSGRSIGPTTSR